MSALMKKKEYKQSLKAICIDNFWTIVACIACFVPLVLCFVQIANGVSFANGGLFLKIFAPTFLILVILLLIYIAFFASSLKITLDDEKIWVNKIFTFKKSSAKSYQEVRFEEIADMKFVSGADVSIDQELLSSSNIKRASAYLGLVKYDGKVLRMCIDSFDDKTIKALMDDILAHIQAKGLEYHGKSSDRIIKETLESSEDDD